MSCRGFTLVELVLVILVIGVLAVYAAPRFDRSGYDLAAARDELTEALRYAQAQSMSHTGAAPFGVSLTGSGYRVTQDGADIPDPFSGGSSYQQSWSDISIAPAPTDISFDSRGRPGWSGAITLTGGGGSMSVSVEPTTGYVH